MAPPRGRPRPQDDGPLPHAQHLRPPTSDTTVWLDKYIHTHQDCFSPLGRQTLHDFLDETPYAAICARDQITLSQARRRRYELMLFFRRHVYGRETSCAEEQAAWRRGWRRWQAQVLQPLSPLWGAR